MSKKIGRPVMMRISRHEEFYLGSARPGFQGRIKMGFAADGRVTAELTRPDIDEAAILRHAMPQSPSSLGDRVQ